MHDLPGERRRQVGQVGHVVFVLLLLQAGENGEITVSVPVVFNARE